jgi:hypothetical protein
MPIGLSAHGPQGSWHYGITDPRARGLTRPGDRETLKP